MNERERAKLFNIAVINAMALIFAGFLHILLLSPQAGSIEAMAPLMKELGEKKAAAAKSSAELKKEKDNFIAETLYIKDYFKKNFAPGDIERIQGDLALLSKELNSRYFNIEYSLKKIYFIEALEVKASFKSVDAADFLRFIDLARPKFYLASKMISFNEFSAKQADITFDFYIPFNAFKIRNLFEGNL